MENSSERYVQRLLEASSKKLELLQGIASLTKAQQQALEEDNIDSLNNYISQKQALIDRIDKLDEEFNVYFLRLKQVARVKDLAELPASSIKDADLLKQVIGEIMALLSEINKIETGNSKLLKTIMKEVTDNIKKLNQNKKVSNAYGSLNNLNSSAYFIDKKK